MFLHPKWVNCGIYISGLYFIKILFAKGASRVLNKPEINTFFMKPINNNKYQVLMFALQCCNIGL
jgi:hypothetical protein